MLDQLIKFGKEQLSGQLKQEAKLNDDQVGKSLNVAQETITDGLKDQILGGNLSGVMNLFNGKSSPTSSNPIVSSLISTYASNLISKVGLSPAIAQTVTNMVIPALMSKFASKDTGEAHDEKGLLSKLGMSGDSAITGMLGGILGNKGGDLLGGIGKMFG